MSEVLSSEGRITGIASEDIIVGVVVRPMANGAKSGLSSEVNPTIGTDGLTPEQHRKLSRSLKRVARRIQFRLFLDYLRLYVGKLLLECRYTLVSGCCSFLRYFHNLLRYRHIFPP